MIKSNQMDELLDMSEVKWKPLRDITLPTSNIRWRDTKDTYRYIDLTSVSRETNTIIETTKISAENAPSRARKLVEENDVIFATTRPAQQRLCLITEEFSGEVASTGYCILRACKDEVLPRWIYHWITSGEFKKYVEENQSGSAYPAISDAKVKEFKIPVPPLNVQEKIVRILDTFTERTAELIAQLEAEREARKKQYTYYHNELLTFVENEVKWGSLMEIFDIFAGGDVPKDALSNMKTEEFNVPVLSNGIDNKALYGWTNKAKIEKPSLTISARGTIGWTSFRDAPFYPVIRLLVLTPKINLNLKYAYYYMKTIEGNYNVSKNGIPQLTKPMVSDIKFPIPPLSEQERIVSILDKFDVLTSSIIKSLSSEIELRQKQYKYYRNILLCFPHEKVEV